MLPYAVVVSAWPLRGASTSLSMDHLVAPPLPPSPLLPLLSVGEPLALQDLPPPLLTVSDGPMGSAAVVVCGEPTSRWDLPPPLLAGNHYPGGICLPRYLGFPGQIRPVSQGGRPLVEIDMGDLPRGVLGGRRGGVHEVRIIGVRREAAKGRA